ncbi:MAG: hypothetical protein M1832_002165 [Thelocarpon impressellum]|nr:MAG: hypothetical protein M1832_002165 [Thelocarpon impressellum]
MSSLGAWIASSIWYSPLAALRSSLNATQWVLPGLPDEHTGTDKPSVIHYPHFSTSAVHSDFVDWYVSPALPALSEAPTNRRLESVMFHGDLILSKCAREGKIVLWRIEGFSSTAPAPPPHAAPTTHTSRETRSAFGSGGYQRLLQFHVPHTEPFYMRFGLLQGQPQAHPVLAMGNAKSKVFLWDFAQLEAWSATAGPTLPFRVPVTKSHHAGGGGGSRSGTTSGLAQREGSIASTTSSSLVSRGGTAATSDAAQPSKMHDLGDPAGELLAHATATIPNIWFCARQAAWSVGGDWLVVVGDHRVIAVFGRWDKDRPEGKS